MFKMLDYIRVPSAEGAGMGGKGPKDCFANCYFRSESLDNCNLQFRLNVVFGFSPGTCMSQRRR